MLTSVEEMTISFLQYLPCITYHFFRSHFTSISPHRLVGTLMLKLVTEINEYFDSDVRIRDAPSKPPSSNYSNQARRCKLHMLSVSPGWGHVGAKINATAAALPQAARQIILPI